MPGDMRLRLKTLPQIDKGFGPLAAVEDGLGGAAKEAGGHVAGQAVSCGGGGEIFGEAEAELGEGAGGDAVVAGGDAVAAEAEGGGEDGGVLRGGEVEGLVPVAVILLVPYFFFFSLFGSRFLLWLGRGRRTEKA